ncbi:hypothetical protein B566_EDAN005078 [Ephemera danica]|nr:hypothetical protein B566_EDAN005078 [Ephemera danica]
MADGNNGDLLPHVGQKCNPTTTISDSPVTDPGSSDQTMQNLIVGAPVVGQNRTLIARLHEFMLQAIATARVWVRGGVLTPTTNLYSSSQQISSSFPYFGLMLIYDEQSALMEQW